MSRKILHRVSTSSFVSHTLGSLVLLNICLPIGLAAGVQSSVYTAVFAVHAVWLVFSLYLCCRELGHSVRDAGSLGWLAGVSLALFVLSTLCLSSLPVTARDALIHHLAVPRLWIAEGRIHEIPWHEWSYYPMLAQLAFAQFLHLGSEPLCALYHAVFGIFLAGTVHLFLRDEFRRNDIALFGASLVLLLPVCLNLAGTPLVDLVLAFACSAGLFSMLQGRWLLAGTAWGLALCVKPNGILAFAIALVVTIPYLTRRFGFRQWFSSSCLIGLLAIAVFAPWAARNYFWTGNPFYPQFKGLFGNVSEANELRGLTPLQQRVMLYEESLAEVAFLPLRIFLQGEDNNPRLFDGRLSPLLLLAIPALLLAPRGSPTRTIGAYSAVYVLAALLLTGARVRYLAPAFGALAASAALSLRSMRAEPGILRFLPHALLVVQLTFSGRYLADLFTRLRTLPYLRNEIGRIDYQAALIPEFRLLQHINTHLPPTARILAVFTGNQFYLYEREVRSSGHSSAEGLVRIIRNNPNADAILDSMQQDRFTHLLTHMQRLGGVLDAELSSDEKERWQEFTQSSLQLVAADRGFGLFELRQP